MSQGTLFFKRQRRSGRASSVRRGNVSNGRIKTRTTGSGINNASGASDTGTRLKTLRSAVLTASGCTTLASTGEGIMAPIGKGSVAWASRLPPVFDHWAAATCVEAISMTSDGCGMALSHRSRRRTGPISKNLVVRVAELVKERHLVNFAQRGGAGSHLGQT